MTGQGTGGGGDQQGAAARGINEDVMMNITAVTTEVDSEPELSGVEDDDVSGLNTPTQAEFLNRIKGRPHMYPRRGLTAVRDNQSSTDSSGQLSSIRNEDSTFSINDTVPLSQSMILRANLNIARKHSLRVRTARHHHSVAPGRNPNSEDVDEESTPGTVSASSDGSMSESLLRRGNELVGMRKVLHRRRSKNRSSLKANEFVGVDANITGDEDRAEDGNESGSMATSRISPDIVDEGTMRQSGQGVVPAVQAHVSNSLPQEGESLNLFEESNVSMFASKGIRVTAQRKSLSRRHDKNRAPLSGNYSSGVSGIANGDGDQNEDANESGSMSITQTSPRVVDNNTTRQNRSVVGNAASFKSHVTGTSSPGEAESRAQDVDVSKMSSFGFEEMHSGSDLSILGLQRGQTTISSTSNTLRSNEASVQSSKEFGSEVRNDDSQSPGNSTYISSDTASNPMDLVAVMRNAIALAQVERMVQVPIDTLPENYRYADPRQSLESETLRAIAMFQSLIPQTNKASPRKSVTDLQSQSQNEAEAPPAHGEARNSKRSSSVRKRSILSIAKRKGSSPRKCNSSQASPVGSEPPPRKTQRLDVDRPTDTLLAAVNRISATTNDEGYPHSVINNLTNTKSNEEVEPRSSTVVGTRIDEETHIEPSVVSPSSSRHNKVTPLQSSAVSRTSTRSDEDEQPRSASVSRSTRSDEGEQLHSASASLNSTRSEVGEGSLAAVADPSNSESGEEALPQSSVVSSTSNRFTEEVQYSQSSTDKRPVTTFKERASIDTRTSTILSKEVRPNSTIIHNEEVYPRSATESVTRVTSIKESRLRSAPHNRTSTRLGEDVDIPSQKVNLPATSSVGRSQSHPAIDIRSSTRSSKNVRPDSVVNIRTSTRHEEVNPPSASVSVDRNSTEWDEEAHPHLTTSDHSSTAPDEEAFLDPAGLSRTSTGSEQDNSHSATDDHASISSTKKYQSQSSTVNRTRGRPSRGYSHSAGVSRSRTIDEVQPDSVTSARMSTKNKEVHPPSSTLDHISSASDEEEAYPDGSQASSGSDEEDLLGDSLPITVAAQNGHSHSSTVNSTRGRPSRGYSHSAVATRSRTNAEIQSDSSISTRTSAKHKEAHPRSATVDRDSSPPTDEEFYPDAGRSSSGSDNEDHLPESRPVTTPSKNGHSQSTTAQSKRGRPSRGYSHSAVATRSRTNAEIQSDSSISTRTSAKHKEAHPRSATVDRDSSPPTDEEFYPDAGRSSSGSDNEDHLPESRPVTTPSKNGHSQSTTAQSKRGRPSRGYSHSAVATRSRTNAEIQPDSSISTRTSAKHKEAHPRSATVDRDSSPPTDEEFYPDAAAAPSSSGSDNEDPLPESRPVTTPSKNGHSQSTTAQSKRGRPSRGNHHSAGVSRPRPNKKAQPHSSKVKRPQVTEKSRSVPQKKLAVKKDLAYYMDNSNLVTKRHIQAGLQNVHGKVSNQIVDRLAKFLSKSLEGILDELSTLRENGVFSYRELEKALERRKLIDPSLGNNSLLLVIAQCWDRESFVKAKGILIPEPGFKDTM